MHDGPDNFFLNELLGERNDIFVDSAFIDDVFSYLDRLNAMIQPGMINPENNPDNVFHSKPVPVDDVLRVVIETIELAESGVNCHGDPIISDDARLWMKIYLAAIEQRYTDVISGSLLYLASTSRLEELNDTERRRETFVRRLIILGGNLVEADTSEEFQAALEAFADPVGSFRTKRVGGAHVTVGAYFGGIVGADIELEKKDKDGDEVAYYVGITLPIGVELSVGLDCCSLGVFVSPVDLGVVANYRIEGGVGNGGTVEPPKIGWRQLFAPSAYVVAGPLKDFPFTIGLGAQYAPAARSDGADELRMSLMFAIDVTLFQF